MTLVLFSTYRRQNSMSLNTLVLLDHLFAMLTVMWVFVAIFNGADINLEVIITNYIAEYCTSLTQQWNTTGFGHVEFMET